MDFSYLYAHLADYIHSLGEPNALLPWYVAHGCLFGGVDDANEWRIKAMANRYFPDFM